MKKYIGFIIGLLFFGLRTVSAQSYPDPTRKKSYSVLAESRTLKVAVTQSGVYKISYDDLLQHHLLSGPVPSAKIALFGNKSGMLPFFNLPDIYDDLSHLPIRMFDGEDGTFGPGDYFLFFGESPHRWSYTPQSDEVFSFQTNHYSDTSYYFVGTNAEFPHRIENLPPASDAASRITSFPEHIHYEKDMENLCNGGITWLGESFSFSGNQRNIVLNTPDPAGGETARIRVQTGAQSTGGTATFSVVCGSSRFSIFHSSISSDKGDCTRIASAGQEISVSGNQTTVSLTFNKTGNTGNGYLDYISLYYSRKLKLSDGQLLFRHPEAIDRNARFVIEAAPTTLVWDITDIYRIRMPDLKAEGNGTIGFSATADRQLHEYIAFDPAACPSPAFVKITPPQNLHGLKNIAYTVVTHPDFLDQARQVAELHRERDNLSVFVATTEQVYNEYSAGAKDPSAIRLFLKSIRDKSESDLSPRYLLLFGAASYDYKNILGQNSDFVPTLQSHSNNKEGGGDPMEDNFAYLDDLAGVAPIDNNTARGTLAIAVGRLPVRSKADADAVLEKIDIYSSPTYRHDPTNPNLSGNFGNWRNELVFVTDDDFEDSMEKNILARNYILENRPDFHISKLYSDSYERATTSTSNRIPAMENAIRNHIENGCLFMGYLGHSGWDAWSDEKILTLDIINNWKKSYTFPIIMSSSCTFAYFDQAGKVSGAELSVLKEHSGAIATIATARTAMVGNIENIQRRFAERIIEKQDGKIPTLGESFLYAKTTNTQGAGHRFILLGDPGLKIAQPKYHVKTLKINGVSTDSAVFDTLKALAPITIEGCITRPDSSVLSDFNGTLLVRIYDKAVTKKTLGLPNPQNNNANNAVVSYTDQNSLLFQGTTEVKDGQFSFSFIVPKDIQYNFGYGRINYYAYSDTTDANGSFSRIVTGGFNENAVIDTTPPVVDLYINKNNFFGGTVGSEPYLYAEISDEFGINTTGSGIGHDMTLIIDEDIKNPIVVNDRFRYNTGSYREGTLNYPLELEPGKHTARLKVWNINNISTSASIEFTVDGSSKPRIFDMKVVPNPARGEYVDFYFNHNGIGGGIERCEFSVFNLQGAKVADFSYRMSDLSGYSAGPLRWNLRNNGGKRIQAGMYVCHMKAVSADGKISRQGVKLIVVD